MSPGGESRKDADGSEAEEAAEENKKERKKKKPPRLCAAADWHPAAQQDRVGTATPKPM
jgi:hypothetical protein